MKDLETSMICIHSPIRSVIDSFRASLDCFVEDMYTIWIYSKRVQIECEKRCKGQQRHGIFTNESNEPSNEKQQRNGMECGAKPWYVEAAYFWD